MCGGTIRCRPTTTMPPGLSPRVRGNLGMLCHPRMKGGSIPACAGEPVLRGGRRRNAEVYPRVCGGTNDRSRRRRLRRGLSPRVRGNLANPEYAPQQSGSIPACAGEPQMRHPHHPITKVYPRVCGGTISQLESSKEKRGLSPRVRGNPPSYARANACTWSIPACAGEPGTHPTQNPGIRVYPRVCGGTISRAYQISGIMGLSPRVRGNHRYPSGTPPDSGSIPACAGEPWPQVSGTRAPRVYPRVCGGTDWDGRQLFTGYGLSPRVRGNRAAVAISAWYAGSIPACAGEPPAG